VVNSAPFSPNRSHRTGLTEERERERKRSVVRGTSWAPRECVTFLEDSQDSPARPSGKSIMKRKLMKQNIKDRKKKCFKILRVGFEIGPLNFDFALRIVFSKM
jgi:hypothetical protein